MKIQILYILLYLIIDKDNKNATVLPIIIFIHSYFMKKQADQPFFIPKMGVFKNGPWGGIKNISKSFFLLLFLMLCQMATFSK